MEPTSRTDHVEQFVLELLGTGLMLSGLVRDLTDALPEDAYPGEDNADVVIEMLRGTMGTALDPIDPPDLARATELIELARARVLEHLQLAYGLSRRIHGTDSGVGRGYG